VPIAGVEEELGLVGRLRELSRRGQIPVLDHDRVVLHEVDLHGHAARREAPDSQSLHVMEEENLSHARAG
jgi:hypothetical protein